MSDELESLASAYLDNELPPEVRASLEHAITADASRAEELRSLAAVRDLVAALPRPTSPDVSAAVLERIVASRRRTFISSVSRSTWIATATAAGLLAIAIGLATFSHLRVAPHRSDYVAAQLPVAPPSPPQLIARVPVVDPEPMVPPAALAAPPSPVATVDNRGAIPLDFLRRPEIHRVFLVSAQDDAIDANETAILLEISSHRNFFRLDVPVSGQEPSGPSAVFAAELDPNELATLRQRLSGAFAGRLDEIEADHSLLTKLASVSEVTALKGEPAGEILFPQNQMALQSAAVAASSPAPREGESTERSSAPTPPTPTEARPRPDERPSIVLVWVIRPDSR